MYLSVVDKGGEGKVKCKFTLPSKKKKEGELGGDEKKDKEEDDRGIWTVGEGLTQPLGEVRRATITFQSVCAAPSNYLPTLLDLCPALRSPPLQLLTKVDPRQTIVSASISTPSPQTFSAPCTSNVFETVVQPSVLKGRLSCTAYENEPRRMGGVYCYQRPVHARWADTMEKVAPGLGYSRHAVEVEGREVVFGREEVFQTHVGEVFIYVEGAKVEWGHR